MMGRIHSVESFGSVDGPGIRYVVFLQGCPLRCGYCHNPDTWTFAGGTEMSAEELFQKIRRYRAYFGEEGGVTVSGGEALMQPEFVTELFRLCHADGINTCLDTSGCVWNDQVEALLEETDTVLLDIKMTSEEDYARYIGGSLKQTMKFLSELHRRGIPTWVRQVIVEGLNDTEENIQSLNELMAPYDNIVKVELLPFHKMCSTKYEKLGIPFRFDCYPETRQATADRLQQLVRLPGGH
ncbi:MAG: pyruvate formate lyase-activating protein [Clostridiales bacterium]|nr:pyruvate formate lyase-activating protein [Clostridiales bacterium]